MKYIWLLSDPYLIQSSFTTNSSHFSVSFFPQVLFRYALALFKYKEEDILKIHDNVEIYQYLRFFTKTVSDGR